MCVCVCVCACACEGVYVGGCVGVGVGVGVGICTHQISVYCVLSVFSILFLCSITRIARLT